MCGFFFFFFFNFVFFCVFFFVAPTANTDHATSHKNEERKILAHKKRLERTTRPGDVVHVQFQQGECHAERVAQNQSHGTQNGQEQAQKSDAFALRRRLLTQSTAAAAAAAKQRRDQVD